MRSYSIRSWGPGMYSPGACHSIAAVNFKFKCDTERPLANELANMHSVTMLLGGKYAMHDPATAHAALAAASFHCRLLPIHSQQYKTTFRCIRWPPLLRCKRCTCTVQRVAATHPFIYKGSLYPCNRIAVHAVGSLAPA